MTPIKYNYACIMLSYATLLCLMSRHTICEKLIDSLWYVDIPEYVLNP